MILGLTAIYQLLEFTCLYSRFQPCPAYRRQKYSLVAKFFKGSDRQSEVVELSMQYCAQIL